MIFYLKIIDRVVTINEVSEINSDPSVRQTVACLRAVELGSI